MVRRHDKRRCGFVGVDEIVCCTDTPSTASVVGEGNESGSVWDTDDPPARSEIITPPTASRKGQRRSETGNAPLYNSPSTLLTLLLFTQFAKSTPMKFRSGSITTSSVERMRSSGSSRTWYVSLEGSPLRLTPIYYDFLSSNLRDHGTNGQLLVLEPSRKVTVDHTQLH